MDVHRSLCMYSPSMQPLRQVLASFAHMQIFFFGSKIFFFTIPPHLARTCCMFICMYVCMYIRMHVCINTCVCTCVCISIIAESLRVCRFRSCFRVFFTTRSALGYDFYDRGAYACRNDLERLRRIRFRESWHTSAYVSICQPI
jgi:hypothetical protein